MIQMEISIENLLLPNALRLPAAHFTHCLDLKVCDAAPNIKKETYNFFILVLAPKFNFLHLPPGDGWKAAATHKVRERRVQR